MHKVFFALLFLHPLTSHGQDAPQAPRLVRDPAAAFLERSKVVAGPVQIIHADFDADGVEDVAYADHALCGHRGNCSFCIYLRRPHGKYLEVGAIEYRSHFKVSRSRHGGGLVRTYIPGSGVGDIISYRVSSRGVREIGRRGVTLSEDPATSTAFLITRTFRGTTELPRTTIPIEDFTAAHHPGI